MKIAMFTKNLDGMPISELGRAVKGAGFDGADLTVRVAGGGLPAGSVAPATVRRDLPTAVNEFTRLGLETLLLTTDVTSADAPHAVDVFETAAECGVREIRLGYWHYRDFGTFRAQLEAIEQRLGGIAELAARTGVRANVFNHQGGMMSSDPYLMWYWVKDRDPRALGCYVDVEGIALEIGSPKNQMVLDLLGDRVNVMVIKDFEWQFQNGPTPSKRPVSNFKVGLGQGVAPIAESLQRVKQAGANPIITLHCDYVSERSAKMHTREEMLEQAKRDVEYLRGLETW